MNRSSFALFVALLIHFLLVLIFWLLGSLAPEIKKPIKPQEKKIKISLKEMPKKHKKSGDIKKKVKPSQIAPPMPKGSQLKKIIKKPPVKYEPKKPVKKPKLNPKPKPKVVKPKPKPQPKIEPLPPQKPYIALKPKQDVNITKKEPIKKEVKKPVDPLYAMLSQDKSSQDKTQKESKIYNGSSINQDVKELYGNEFGKLSPGQQKYILDNQEIMRRITQQVLTRVARVNLPHDLNVNRSNVIEFYLHPNGDMSDFKFLEKSGYYVLDDTTKETISYAYSRYPRPAEKTLIRYNVFYNLAKY
ncbi:MAG: hypothetical protein U9O83_02660 [Campylobacterota bacterium]|nr:hypothetical protein [Campylobacterota bacterium]